MNLILLTFGERLENHYQAAFAILSFLKDPLVQRVIVVTDQKDFYHFFNGKVDIIDINKQTLNEWQGEQQFFWRIKIKALEYVQIHYPNEHLLYIDSDTFLAGNLAIIDAQLNQGHTLMHKRECALADNTDNTLQKMYLALKGKFFAGIEINAQSSMWNAGVIALPAGKAQEIIRLSLQICDEICTTDCPRRLVEQFAFSIALAHSAEMKACDDVIGHYWGNKPEWNKMIADFFAETLLKQFSLLQCIALVASSDWNKLPLHKKQRSTNLKLKCLIDKLFCDKNIHYFTDKKKCG